MIRNIADAYQFSNIDLYHVCMLFIYLIFFCGQNVTVTVTQPDATSMRRCTKRRRMCLVECVRTVHTTLRAATVKSVFLTSTRSQAEILETLPFASVCIYI